MLPISCFTADHHELVFMVILKDTAVLITFFCNGEGTECQHHLVPLIPQRENASIRNRDCH